MQETMKFPQKWRSIYCGDCYRIVDAEGRSLFVITSDEFAFGNEGDGKGGTVMEYGTDAERVALATAIEALFPDVDDEETNDDIRHEAWSNEVQEIVFDSLDDDDEERGEFMLDYSQAYWDDCYRAGWSPQKSLDELVQLIKEEGYQAFRGGIEVTREKP